MNNKRKGFLLMSPFIFCVVLIILSGMILMILQAPLISLGVVLFIVILWVFLKGVELINK